MLALSQISAISITGASFGRAAAEFWRLDVTFGVQKNLHNHSDGEPITVIAATIWLIYGVVEKSDCCNKLPGRSFTS